RSVSIRVTSSPAIIRRLPPAPSSVVNISGSVVESQACSGCFDVLRNARTAIARRDARAGVVARDRFTSEARDPKSLLLTWPASSPKASAMVAAVVVAAAIHLHGTHLAGAFVTLTLDPDGGAGGRAVGPIPEKLF